VGDQNGGPGNGVVNSASTRLEFANLGTLVSVGLNIAFYGGCMIAFLVALWGAYQYITAGGNKETLAKARNRIMWAIIGFVILIGSFSFGKYITDAIPHNQNVNIQSVHAPN
jgi:Sec-independent protein secretion pathway component TatC